MALDITTAPCTSTLLNRGEQDKPWVNVYNIQNALNNNHFLDVLEVYGRKYGLRRDDEWDQYSAGGNFAERLRGLSKEFRKQVVGAFVRYVGREHVGCVGRGVEEEGNENERRETERMMKKGIKVIVGGVIGDEKRRIMCRVPLMVWGESIGKGKGYVSIGMKRKGLRKEGWERLKCEMWWWREILGARWGGGFILGLNEGRKKGVCLGGRGGEGKVFDESVWKWEEVGLDGFEERAMEGLEWRIEVVDKGERWIEDVGEIEKLLEKGEWKLRPNMKAGELADWPWSVEKKRLAQRYRELSLISGIGWKMVKEGMEKGVKNDYMEADGVKLGVEGLGKRILDMCQGKEEGSAGKIEGNRGNWRGVEERRAFYVDLELGAQDNLYAIRGDEGGEGEYFDKDVGKSRFERREKDALVFMIGCGRMMEGVWEYKSFVAKGLVREEESWIMKEWLEYMEASLQEGDEGPVLFVWGPEKHLLKKALRRMGRDVEQRPYRVVDMLKVVEKGKVSFKGCLSHGLKEVAKAVAGENRERNGVGNGGDAMCLALEAYETGGTLDDVLKYNEEDCRDIWRITDYLRQTC